MGVEEERKGRRRKGKSKEKDSYEEVFDYEVKKGKRGSKKWCLMDFCIINYNQILTMFNHKLTYFFATAAVMMNPYRNTESFSWDMDRAYGINKTGSQDGQMCAYHLEVIIIFSRNSRSHQGRKGSKTKRILVWPMLHLSFDPSHPNIQLCRWRTRLPLHPSHQELEVELKALWRTARTQQTWNCWETRKRSSPNMEKKLRYPSSTPSRKRWERPQKR